MRRAVLAACFAALPACTGNESALEPGDGGAPPEGPPGKPVAEVLGPGTADGVELVSLYDAPVGRVATDLDFNPVRPGELWVVFREITDGSPCDEPLPGQRADAVCGLLGGTVAIVDDATASAPAVEVLQDPNAWHFMRLPPAIAFGPGDTFATCGEARTGNWDSDTADYIGPTLWSSDPAIFAIEPPGKNGSHLDMLHATPFCMGIAHEAGNVYWLVNGDVGAIDRYDFADPHEIGGADHSDGRSWRWARGELERVPGVPSHAVYDPRDGKLYVADTGNARVLVLDSRTGQDGDPLPTDDEQMPFITERVGATITELVSPGTLEAPSGIALAGDAVYVTDNATSRISAYDRSGTLLGSLDTGLPAGTLAGIAIGPDGKAYLADLRDGEVRRVDVR